MPELDRPELDWYAATVASAPAIGGPLSRLHGWIGDDIDVPLREDRAAAALMCAGADDGVQTRVPAYYRDARTRLTDGSRLRAPIRMALFPGYLFLGVPKGSDPRIFGWARDVRNLPVLTGFATSGGAPVRIDGRTIQGIMQAAGNGDFDKTREARRAAKARLVVGMEITVADSHYWLRGATGTVERIERRKEGDRVHLVLGTTHISVACDFVIETAALEAAI